MPVHQCEAGRRQDDTSVNSPSRPPGPGQSVVVVDCDLRRPRMHEFFGSGQPPGLHHGDGRCESWTRSLTDRRRAESLGGHLGRGTPRSVGAALHRTAEASCVRSCLDFDLVIIDTPPVLVVADPLVMSSSVDGVILVASAGDTDRRQIKRATEELAKVRLRWWVRC